MTHTEALARGNQAIWDFREADTLEDRMRLAHEIDELTPLIMQGTRIVQWPEGRRWPREAFRSASRMLGVLIDLTHVLGARGA